MVGPAAFSPLLGGDAPTDDVLIGIKFGMGRGAVFLRLLPPAEALSTEEGSEDGGDGRYPTGERGDACRLRLAPPTTFLRNSGK